MGRVSFAYCILYNVLGILYYLSIQGIVMYSLTAVVCRVISLTEHVTEHVTQEVTAVEEEEAATDTTIFCF